MEARERRRSPRRIAVVGTSGSGKTTLARRLAQHLDVPLHSPRTTRRWLASLPAARHSTNDE